MIRLEDRSCGRRPDPRVIRRATPLQCWSDGAADGRAGIFFAACLHDSQRGGSERSHRDQVGIEAVLQILSADKLLGSSARHSEEARKSWEMEGVKERGGRGQEEKKGGPYWRGGVTIDTRRGGGILESEVAGERNIIRSGERRRGRSNWCRIGNVVTSHRRRKVVVNIEAGVLATYLQHQ